MEIWRHGRRICADDTTMMEPTSTNCDSKMQEHNEHSGQSCTAKEIHPSALALTATRQKMNDSFCGIFGTDIGTDMELVP